MITKDAFFKKVDGLKNQTITSKSGSSSYSDIIRINNICIGIRSGSSGSEFKLNLDELYKAYEKSANLNTKSLIEFMGKKRCRSAAIAIMMAANLLDEYGNTLK